MLVMFGLACAIFSAESRSSASMILKPVMDSVPHGSSLVPLFEISRPLLRPPWSTVLSAIDSNHLSQAAMISGVGCSNPKCSNKNFFIALSLLVFSLFHSPRAHGDRLLG